MLTLAISDVPFDDPAVIASGPTVPDPSTLADARAIVARRKVPLPASAAALLDSPASETPKPGNPVFSADRVPHRRPPGRCGRGGGRRARSRPDTSRSCSAPTSKARRARSRPRTPTWRRTRAPSGRRVAIISGGELTVTIGGQGRGGPNQEYALALAVALDGRPGIAALAADTDGTDGGAGSADDPAGAIIDDTTLARARALGLDPAAFLADNDSTGFFERLSDLVSCGPTRTNVNDCRIILVGLRALAGVVPEAAARGYPGPMASARGAGSRLSASLRPG